MSRVKLPVIMFDVDGVLADFLLSFTKRAAKLFPKAGIVPVSQRDNPSWDAYGRGLAHEHINKTWDDVRDDAAFWLGLPTLASLEEIEAVNRLNRETGDVYFVTGRPGAMTKLHTERWLEAHGIERPTVLMSKYKGEAAKVLGAHFSIEDKAENAWAVAWLSPGTMSFLIDRPYNEYDPKIGSSKIVRIASVAEYVDAVRKEVARR